MARRKPSLADRVRAQGIDPEGPEGGRAMMRALTMEDVARIRPRGKALTPGSVVSVRVHLVGGSQQISGVVTWDNGRGDVNVAVQRYGRKQILRTKKDAAGNLNVYE